MEITTVFLVFFNVPLNVMNICPTAEASSPCGDCSYQQQMLQHSWCLYLAAPPIAIWNSTVVRVCVVR
ncbi:putative signal peptide protein [Puccinia sorghi]|uniref:Putative signal peptide protein n=1 Tax=Puccinia sorghi TaxID=27349 RepID=A0A0L6UJ01_9BASI|nr:putative signal peptide protein [Puccinia sorghi]